MPQVHACWRRDRSGPHPAQRATTSSRIDAPGAVRRAGCYARAPILDRLPHLGRSFGQRPVMAVDAPHLHLRQPLQAALHRVPISALGAVAGG
jgi:hypothetical protein